jgi:hypothetical protein
MKRILIVSPFPPIIGGVSIGAQRLYETLINSGYSVIKLNTHFRNERFNRSKILKYAKYLLLPFFLLMHKRFDVIHFRVSGVLTKLYISFWRFLFSRKTKFIISIHGEVNHILEARLGAYSLSKFDKIICVKPGDSINLPPYLRSKTVEIPGFIPPVLTIDPVNNIPDLLNSFLNRNSLKMLINGKIIYNDKYSDLYGFEDAIKLLEKLRNNSKNVDLIIIVIGFTSNKRCTDYIKHLKGYIVDKGLDDHVCWIENVNMELWPLFKRVNVLLRPTKSDGDALSIRESLYLKTPVVASNVVPRPLNTIVYDINSETDFYNKTVFLLENYEECISNLGNNNINFAEKIIEEYESW